MLGVVRRTVRAKRAKDVERCRRIAAPVAPYKMDEASEAGEEVRACCHSAALY